MSYVRPSVWQNLPWFLFCRFILIVNLCIWSHFGSKSVFWPFLGYYRAETGDFGDIVPPNFPVAGLSKFGHMRFFGDSRWISPHVFFIFQKNCLWGPYQASKNGPEPKNSDFCDIVPPNFLVAGLSKLGHMRFFEDSRWISPHVFFIFP